MKPDWHIEGATQTQLLHEKLLEGPSLDDYNMVRVLARLVQQGVGGHHVIHHIALADLLHRARLVRMWMQQ